MEPVGDSATARMGVAGMPNWARNAAFSVVVFLTTIYILVGLIRGTAISGDVLLAPGATYAALYPSWGRARRRDKE